MILNNVNMHIYLKWRLYYLASSKCVGPADVQSQKLLTNFTFFANFIEYLESKHDILQRMNNQIEEHKKRLGCVYKYFRSFSFQLSLAHKYKRCCNVFFFSFNIFLYIVFFLKKIVVFKEMDSIYSVMQ